MKDPNFLKSLEFMFFLCVFKVFLVLLFFGFLEGFFLFLKFLEFFCFAAVSGFSPLPLSFFK